MHRKSYQAQPLRIDTRSIKEAPVDTTAAPQGFWRRRKRRAAAENAAQPGGREETL